MCQHRALIKTGLTCGLQPPCINAHEIFWFNHQLLVVFEQFDLPSAIFVTDDRCLLVVVLRSCLEAIDLDDVATGHDSVIDRMLNCFGGSYLRVMA